MSNKSLDSDAVKSALIEQLKKVPIIQFACEKCGIARSTFYRWRDADEAFAAAIDDALYYGKQFINDLAESQLISAIKDKHMTAIIFWLKTHHRDYGTRIEVSGRIQGDPDLTDEQKEAIEQALRYSPLAKPESDSLAPDITNN